MNPRTKLTCLLPALFLLSVACSGEDTPPPAEDPVNPWDGKSYALAISASRWSEPRGIGQEIDGFVPVFWLKVEGSAPEAFDVTLATATLDGVQDDCNPTQVVPASAEPPNVTIGPTDFPLRIQHIDEPIVVQGTIYDLTITNILPDGDVLAEEGEFVGTMDFRETYELFTLLVTPTPEAVCNTFFMNYEIPCEPCPTDQEPYCLTLKAVRLGATELAGEIQTIDPADIDPACSEPL